jgi:tetratricopeptide (TPR) repeat protein
MSSANGTVNLDWIRRYDGILGIGAHAISDEAHAAILAKDSSAHRTYGLLRLEEGEGDAGPQVSRSKSFTLEAIHYSGSSPKGDFLYVLTDNDVYFILQEDGGPAGRSSLQARHGEMFLDLQVSGIDRRRTAVVLTQDRGSTSYTVTCLDADEQSRIRPVWSKSWTDPIHCVAISSDGEYVAFGQWNGSVTLMNRQRRIVWTYASSEDSPVLAVAVDEHGSVFALDTGGVKRHDSDDGSILWRLPLPIDGQIAQDRLPRAYISVDMQARIAVCGINTIDVDNTPIGLALAVSGTTGDIIWDEMTSAAITGVAVAPGGKWCMISCRGGELLMLSMSLLATPRQKLQALASTSAAARAQELFAAAQAAFAQREFAETLKLLAQVFAHDPAMYGAGSLYDEAAWQLRETVMSTTKTISAKSLATVELALELLPYEEKLIARRNALARLIADQISREAAHCVEDGRLEDAIGKYLEALTIEPGQSDLRNSLRAACDQLAILLLKQADAAFHDDRFDEAIGYLERVQELRPGEPAIAKRLEHARGLQAFATGMRHYIRRDYHEAVFWFRKALATFPDHAEAARYLEFAEKFTRKPSSKPSEEPAAEAGQVGERFGMLE